MAYIDAQGHKCAASHNCFIWSHLQFLPFLALFHFFRAEWPFPGISVQIHCKRTALKLAADVLQPPL